MTQIPSVADGQLRGVAAGEPAGVAVGSPAWFAWLAGDATGPSRCAHRPGQRPAALPRLRPHCQFLEVRAADLGFSVEEAATFLGAGMGLRLEWEQVATVVESLTERELEVLRLLGPRSLRRRVAAELFVEQSTVKTRVIDVSSKLGVDSRTQAVARARAAAAGLPPGRGFHPASPPFGGRAPPATPPS